MMNTEKLSFDLLINRALIYGPDFPILPLLHKTLILLITHFKPICLPQGRLWLKAVLIDWTQEWEK